MKTFLISMLMLIIGVAAGAFAFARFGPVSNDFYGRLQAFEPENRDWFFQNASEVFPTRTVARNEETAALPRASASVLNGFTYTYNERTLELSDLYPEMETSGLVILHRGEIIHESYGRGAGPGTQFTTWSLVKSITSTLVGFAVADGLIDSVDDPLTKYLPELAGTGYDGVSIKHALQMSSGVRFDPDLWEGEAPDTVNFITRAVVLQRVPAFDLAATYERENEPGTVFNYNSAESQILIELVRRVSGMNAAKYLEVKMWRPLGMEHDAGWIIDRASANGAEIGGAMFNASLRDWARFGLLIEQDGVWNGQPLLPEDWVARATVSDEDHLKPGIVHPNGNRGYAWHWWTYGDGTFTASGANGQTLYIDQANDIVVARASAWEEGYVQEHDEQSFIMYKALADWLSFRDQPAAGSETAITAAQ